MVRTCALAVVLLCASASVFAKSYDHPLIEQTFRLTPYGDAEVTDVRTFRFRGSFSWAELRLKGTGKYGTYGVEYLDVRDASTGTQLQYETFSDGDEKVLKWYYSAENEVKRFQLRYRIRNAVQKYGDVAQFYWKAVEDEHAPISSVKIRVIPPRPSPSLFKVFVHSRTEPGTLVFANDYSEARVEVSKVPETSYVELRVLLNPLIFPAAPLLYGQSYESLLEDERRDFERVSEEYAALRKQQLLDERLWLLAGLLCAGQVVAMIWAYARYGREPDVNYHAVYEREPPREIPPAVVPAILSMSGYDASSMGNAFAATLFEAARLGYLEVREVEKPAFFGLLRDTDLAYALTDKGRDLLFGRTVERKRNERRLEPFEVEVLRVAFREAGAGDFVTSDRIGKWGKEMVGKKSRFLLFIEVWGPQLRSWFEHKYFVLTDPVSSQVRGVITASSLLVGIPLLFTTQQTGSIVAVVVCACLAAISWTSLGRRTPEAALEFKRWHAFRRMMTDFTALKDAGPKYLALWELYLVYAVALGVANKLLENLKMVAKEYRQDLPAPVWFHSRGGVPGTVSLASLDALSSSMANFSNMARALSTASSTGGGFSIGGGGGGGGGSSSAG